MDPNQFPVNNLLPSLPEGAFHTQHAVGQTAHPTYLTTDSGYALADGHEAVLGSPFPQYDHMDRDTTPPVPLHSPGFAKPGFLPFEANPHLDQTSPVSLASGMSYGRRAGISHPRPISHARNPLVQPGSPMVVPESPILAQTAVRTRTPVPRGRTPTLMTLPSGPNPPGNITPGHISRPMSTNPVSNLVAGTPTAIPESPRETTTPKNEESERTLMRLTASTASWPLADLALKVKMVETGHLALRTDPFLQALALPGKNDRAAHVFGMAWLQRATEPSPATVLPRMRFYARYAEVCADYNLKPVSPATFGRLVYILHPTLKTRRLGGRGKSKYHYCGLALVGSGPPAFPLLDPLQAHTPPFSASPGLSPNTVSPAFASVTSGTPGFTPRVTSGTPVGTTPVAHTPAAGSTTSSAATADDSHRAAHSGPGTISLSSGLAGPLLLKYVPSLFAAIDALNVLAPLALPSVYPYLAKEREVDCDIADTVHLLYRVHCALVFELIRFLKVDRLSSIFEALQVVMTAPVLKLFTTDLVASWVCDCDLVTYRAVIKMLARLLLQTVSPEIIVPLKSLADNYVEQMGSALQYKFPESFVAMKLKSARRFIALVKCLVRCIEAGPAATGILSSRSDKDSMLQDWLQLDMHDLVLRELPCALENSIILGEILEKTFLQLFEDNDQDPLPRFASFLFDLPARFPNTSPWLFSLVLSNFLTTCLREMSFVGAQSFGRWWLVRCWVDEYLSWCFQLGGFLYDEFGDTNELGVINNPSTVDKENSFIDLMEKIYGNIKPETNWS